MQIEKKKLAYALSALWGMISLPVSEVIYDDVVEESGLFMRLFALLLALMPVWLVFGWRWLTDNRPVAPKLWLGVTALGILTTIGFAGDRYLDELVWIPILALVFFLALVWAFERGDMLWWRNKSLVRSPAMPSAINPNNSVSPTGDEELRYYEAISDFITLHRFYDSFLELQGTDKGYCIASMKMHKAAYLSGQPQVVVAALTMDSIKMYEKSRQRSIAFLQSLENKYCKEEEEEEDVDSYHPALDRAVSDAVRFLETENMYAPSRREWMPIDIAAELLVYIASYLALLNSGQNISPIGWNSFKASIENRILGTLENPPSLSGHIVTPESETFIDYVSDYFAEMTRVEELVGNRNTALTDRDLQPLVSRILINLGSDDPQHQPQLQAFLADISKFASREIIPKVLRIFK